MKKAISVIVTVRGNEPFLKPTLANIRTKIGCKHEIIVVYDGDAPNTDIDADQIIHLKKARGVGGARHRGIESAIHSIIFLTDSHMNFSQDFGKVILDWYSKKANMNDITCGQMYPCFQQSLIMDKTQRHTGARFVLKSQEQGSEYWAMSGKWARQKVNEPIGCIYGACYAFRREWYKTLGEPLQLLTGWGMDEEYLSAASWLAGGRCVLLEYDAGHLFRDSPSFQTGRNDAMLRLANRMRFIDLLPAPDKTREELSCWLSLNTLAADFGYCEMYKQDAQRKEVIEASKIWAEWDWSKLEPFIDLVAKPLGDRQAESRRRRPQLSTSIIATQVKAAMVQMRRVFYCPSCGKINTFRVDRTSKGIEKDVRYGRCGNCGLRGSKTSRDGFERINWRGQAV